MARVARGASSDIKNLHREIQAQVVFSNDSDQDLDVNPVDEDPPVPNPDGIVWLAYFNVDKTDSGKNLRYRLSVPDLPPGYSQVYFWDGNRILPPQAGNRTFTVNKSDPAIGIK